MAPELAGPRPVTVSRQVTCDSASAKALSRIEVEDQACDWRFSLVRFPTIGWKFQFPISGSPELSVWARPADSDQAAVDRLERELGGPVPLSLASWWRTVGSVCLTRTPGSGPQIEYPDPLVVLPPNQALDELAEWREDAVAQEVKPRFAAPIALDVFHKEDVSGGAPYEIELPDERADAVLLNLEPALTFVQYLRHAFAWAGLPGYAEVYDTPPPELAAIASRLEPL